MVNTLGARNRERAFLSVLMALFFTSSLYAQNGVTVIDSLNQRHGGPSPSYGFYYASCWGYVAPDGHEYALLGCYSGTSIIDIDGSPIREVAYIPGSNSLWKEIKVWGHYAYAVSENSAQGVQIIDLQYLPDSAHLVRSVFTIGPRNVANSHTVTVADGYLYLNGGSSNGTTIYSLADPINPTYLGQFQTAYVHDSYVRNDTLLAAAINGQGLYIVSVANKATPVQLGLISYTGSGTHNAWLDITGKYAYTSDEVGSTSKTMKVWDIQSLPLFTQLPPFAPSPTTVIHNIHGRGYYAYVAHYKGGVFVADVHNPTAIVNAGGFNTYRGGGSDANYAGCWGVFPYFPSGKWIASDTQTGLYVMRFNGLVPRIRSPLLAPATGDTITQNVSRTFRWHRAASKTEDPHYYQLHVFGPGVDTLLRVNDTSYVLSSLSGLQNGQTYRWHAWIKDEFTSVSSQDTFRFVYRTTTDVAAGKTAPEQFSLSQNYPNPFNPTTVVRFQVPVSGHVTLKVVNLLGEEVATLFDGVRAAGEYEARFDGAGLASGVYFYRMMTSNGFSETRKMALMK